MPYCGPVCAVPSCASSPVVGFGSRGLGCGYGYGSRWGLGSGCGWGWGSGYGRVLGYGSSYGWGGLGYGGMTDAASFGVSPGAHVSCLNQLPSSETFIQPPPYFVTIPGVILSATCKPLAVGGYTPCAPSGSAYPGWCGGYLGFKGRKCSIC